MLAETSMPAQWRLETLGNLAHYINGRAFKPEDWGDTGLPIIRIEQINNPDAEYDYFEGVVAPDHVIEDGDLLFSWSATLTTLVWDRGPAVLNQHIFKVVPKPGTDRNYLHHQLDYLIEGLAGHSHGSTMKHIKKSDLLPYPVHVPPFPEQRHIAEILNTADRAIGKSEALISKLKHIKTGLMHDLLTCGVDEHGQLRDPEAHPEQFQESPLGRLSRDWAAVAIESVAANEPHAIVDGPFGSNLKSQHYREQGIPVIQSGFVTSGEFTAHSYVYVDETLFQAQRRSAVRPGDIVMAKIGAQCGSSAILPDGHPVGILAGNSLKISTDNRRCRADYLLRVLHYFYDTDRIDLIRTETAQPAISLRNLRMLKVPLPKVSEQDFIVSILDTHDARIRAEEAYRDKLKLQKKGLMEDLLTGRVRVKAAQEVGS
jgi:type I restriction enzyme, S subunit